MKKILQTRALTTTALLTLAGLGAPVVAQSDASAQPAAQQIGPNGVPVSQQLPQGLRANRPLLKPAMIDLDELAKQPRLKPGMERRLPGVRAVAGDPVSFVPGVSVLNPLAVPAVESLMPGVPTVVPVILPDQPRKRPEGWSVKPEEPAAELVPVMTEPTVNATDIAVVTDTQPAVATPAVVEVAPNFAFPDASAAAPATASTGWMEAATPALGPSRLTAFGSSDAAAALPATGVSMPSEVVGTMPVPTDKAPVSRMPQISQNGTAFNTPIVTDSAFRSNMPVISDRVPSGVSVASAGLDENGQPLRPAVLPPEVREITSVSLPELSTPSAAPETPESPAVVVAPNAALSSEPLPQAMAVVETPAVQPAVASVPTDAPAPSEPAVAVVTPEPASPVSAPIPELTFRTPAPVEVPTTTVAPVEEPAKLVVSEVPSTPVSTEPVPSVTQPEPVKVAAVSTDHSKPVTPEPTFSNAVSAAAAKLAERAAATAAAPEPIKPEPEVKTATPGTEIEAKLAALREKEQPAAAAIETPAVSAPVSAAPTSAEIPAESAKPELAIQPPSPSPSPSSAPAVAVATDSGKPVEVLPAPTAGSAQDPFTVKGDSVAIRVAELTGTPGMVQWLRDGGGDWQIPEINEAGNGKYTIRTGPDAGAVVAINETTKLRVGRLSRAEVRAMASDAPGAPRRVVVALTRGRVAVIPAPGTAVNIYTPQSLVVVREPTEVIHDTASGTRTVAYVEKSPASAEVMTTP